VAALYVHLPWCVKKCPYCDFNSHVLKANQALPEADYIQALLSDLEQDVATWKIRKPIETIFLGGGTPSLFSAKSLEKLLLGIDRRLGIQSGAEITLEANPGTVEHDLFANYRSVGINRISLGVQSFSDSALKKLGRIHDAKSSHKAIQAIEKSKFEHVNVDIMHGLPGQTVFDGLADLEQACSYSIVDHLSWYQLTIEPNTLFSVQKPLLPTESILTQLEAEGKTYLQLKGFSQYEISAYARGEAAQSRHNVNYWEFGDYLGIGAGAHSKINQHRILKHKQPKAYLSSQAFVYAQNLILQEDLPLEYMLNRSRLMRSFSFADYEQATGLPKDTLFPGLQKALNQGLVFFDMEKEHSKQKIQVTPLGLRYLNDLLGMFMGD
jgi:putative oxygen-independent coproporphyrinogen III oxidase